MDKQPTSFLAYGVSLEEAQAKKLQQFMNRQVLMQDYDIADSAPVGEFSKIQQGLNMPWSILNADKAKSENNILSGYGADNKAKTYIYGVHVCEGKGKGVPIAQGGVSEELKSQWQQLLVFLKMADIKNQHPHYVFYSQTI